MGLLKDVKKGMKEALEQTNEAIGTNTEDNSSVDVMELLNSGAEAYQNRQKEASKSKPKTSTGKSKKSVKNDSDASEAVQENRMLTLDEFCEKELQQAHDEGLENPDFDYRNFYEKGQQIYYVQVFNSLIKQKRIIPGKIRTIYPRTIIAVQPSSQCSCIGYNERDKIFLTHHDAEAYYKTVNLPEDDYKPTKKNKKESEDEDYGDETEDDSNMQDE